MPTLKNPYCTLSDVQNETSNHDAADVDAFITAINAASRHIDGFCRRDFLHHVHDANAPLLVQSSWCTSNTLWLPWPIVELTRIMVDGTELPAAQYRVCSDGKSATVGSRGSALIMRNGVWLPGDVYGQGVGASRLIFLPPKIEVVGEFGYAPAQTNAGQTPSPDLPDDIVRACTIIAAVFSGKSTREFIGADGDRQTVTQRTIPKDVATTLSSYRAPIIP